MILNISSPSLYHAESYGVIANRLARHLGEMGIATNCNDHWRPQLPPSQDGSILLGWPVEFPEFDAWTATGPRIAVTMFESSVLPAGWVAILNQLDAVIVPNRFCCDVFAKAGVSAPLHIAPLGISEVYQPYQRKQSDVMTFLAFGDRGLRKGGFTAIQAFQMAFGNDKRYRLIVKARAPKNVELFSGGNIELIQQDMTEQELYELYCQCDVLINPNRGEGFGLLPREFAATGGISLATNWGGTAGEIEQWGMPIAYTLGKADWGMQPGLQDQDLGDWALPDAEHLVNLLKHIAQNQQVYQAQAMQKAPNGHKLYSWPCFVEKVFHVWEGCTNGMDYGNSN